MCEYIMYTHKYNTGGVRFMKVTEVEFLNSWKKIYYGHSFCKDLNIFLHNKFKQLPSASIGSDNILDYKIFTAPDDDSAILIYELTKEELERNKYDKTI